MLYAINIINNDDSNNNNKTTLIKTVKKRKFCRVEESCVCSPGNENSRTFGCDVTAVP